MKSYVGYANSPIVHNLWKTKKPNDFTTPLRGFSVTRLRGYACFSFLGFEGRNERSAFSRNRVTECIQGLLAYGLTRLRMRAIFA